MARAGYRGDALIGLKPAESEIYALLSGDDVLLTSQGVLRVAARVAGTNSHQLNRLTDGRIDLARLVGSGEDAALRMAALRLLAATRCGVHVAVLRGLSARRLVSERSDGSLSEIRDFHCRSGCVGLDLTLPDSQHPPTCSDECFICREVAGAVDVQLASPAIGIWAAELRRPMRGATMPEAPINEDRNAVLGQEQVGLVPTDTTMQSVPEAEGMDCLS